MNNKSIKPQPRLPAALAFPLKTMPDVVHNRVLAAMLNKVFADEIDMGELDFMDNRTVAIVISDAGVTFRLTLNGNALTVHTQRDSDLTVSGTIYDFMTLISRKQDPDSLVFQRRLVMEGDTELGLALKNFLDSIDVQSSKILSFAETMSVKTLPLYQRLFG